MAQISSYPSLTPQFGDKVLGSNTVDASGSPIIGNPTVQYTLDSVKTLVDQNQQVKIDFLGAVSEMEKLDYKFEKNFIGFQNCSSGEYVQFVRLGNDSWYADAPIKDQQNWDGYLWAGYGDTKSITSMLKLFFEEVPWFDSISWKMRRYVK